MVDRLTPHDANFSGLTGGTVFGPFDVPSVEAMRAALVQIGRANPTHRAFCDLHTTSRGGRWVPLPPDELERRCVAMVSDLATEVPGGPPAWVDRIVQPFPEGRLIHFSVGDSYVIVWFAHVLGDNDFTWFAPGVLRAAAGGPIPVFSQDWRSRAPLSRALLSHFGSRPARLVDAWRASRSRLPTDARQELERPIAFRALGATAPASVAGAIRDWRDANCADVSTSNVWFVAIRRALEAAGIQFSSPGLRILVDGRRYLPENVRVAGNFATAIYVEPSDPYSPRAIDAVLRRNLDSGRPLATMAVSAARHLLFGASDGPGAEGPIRPSLAISNLGRMRPWEDLPGIDADRCNYYCASLPDPFGITVFLAQAAGRMTLTATFSPAVVAEEMVVSALGRLTEDPCGVLAGLPASRLPVEGPARS